MRVAFVSRYAWLCSVGATWMGMRACTLTPLALIQSILKGLLVISWMLWNQIRTRGSEQGMVKQTPPEVTNIHEKNTEAVTH